MMNNAARYYTYASISFSCQANLLISFLRRIPGLNKVIGKNVYGWYKLKNCCAIVGAGIDLLSRAITTVLETYVIIRLIPGWILGRPPETIEYVFVFVLKSIGDCFAPSDLFKPCKEDGMFLNHFMVNPAEYYRYKALRASFWRCAPLVILLWFFVSDWLLALALCVFKCFFVLAGNMLYLRYYRRKQRILPLVFRRALPGVLIAFCWLVLYWGGLKNVDIPSAISFGILLFSIMGSAVLWTCHQKYNDYHLLALRFKDSSMLVMSVSISSSAAETYRETLKKLTWQENQAFYEKNKDLEIHDYMTKAFYKRMGHGIRKQLLTNMALVLLINVVIGILLRSGRLSINADSVQNYSTLLITFSLMFSQAGSMAQLYFYNMDYHLLTLNAYPPALLRKTAFRRLQDTLLIDLISSVFLFAVMLLCRFISGYELPILTVFIFGAVGFLLLVIADLYEWIVYFFVQPYTKDMNVQSPTLKIIGLAGSVTGFCCIFIRRNILSALPILLSVVCVLLLGFRLFSKKIPQTFKLRV